MAWEDAPLILMWEKIPFSNFPVHETKFHEISPWIAGYR